MYGVTFFGRQFTSDGSYTDTIGTIDGWLSRYLALFESVSRRCKNAGVCWIVCASMRVNFCRIFYKCFVADILCRFESRVRGRKASGELRDSLYTDNMLVNDRLRASINLKRSVEAASGFCHAAERVRRICRRAG